MKKSSVSFCDLPCVYVYCWLDEETGEIQHAAVPILAWESKFDEEHGEVTGFKPWVLDRSCYTDDLVDIEDDVRSSSNSESVGIVLASEYYGNESKWQAEAEALRKRIQDNIAGEELRRRNASALLARFPVGKVTCGKCGMLRVKATSIGYCCTHCHARWETIDELASNLEAKV